MENKRIYTLFLLPNGDEIPLSFRSEKGVREHQKEFPEHELVFKDIMCYKETVNMMKAIFTYKKNSGELF